MSSYEMKSMWNNKEGADDPSNPTVKGWACTCVKYFAATLAVHSPSWRQWASLYSLQPKPPPALVLNSTSVTVANGRLSQDGNVPSSSFSGHAVCRPLGEHDWHSCLCVDQKEKKSCCCSSEGGRDWDTYSIAVWAARPSWQAEKRQSMW